MSFFSKIFNFTNDPTKTYKKELTQINDLTEEVSRLTETEVQAEIQNYKKQLAEFTEKDALLKELIRIRPRVFALVRHAAKQSIGQFHYDVQILGGLVLSDGKIAEMKTGEGKTLTATAALALYALAGKGAHLVTVNDYLSRWQASLMGAIFHYLGLSTASIQHEASFLYDPTYQPDEAEIANLEGGTEGLVMDVKHMRPVTRREAYAADITYGTNNEFGFDYLRDNMVQRAEQMVQRDLFYAIVDEVDSILIDEARTPLIISQPDAEPTEKYRQFSRIVNQLQETSDYILDEQHKAANLTDEGITKIEKIINIPNIYDTGQGISTLHHIEQALRAKALYLKDRDYVIRDGEIVIVDEFTGRLMFGRRYSEGLHQAIEAKEGVTIQQESKTLATITFQNLFRLYTKLAGMTGTAKTEEEEFFKIYSLEVVQVPTNMPNQREDLADVIYKTESAKFKAIAREVKERHKQGQPMLIGTVSIAKNELLAEHLKAEGLRFELLNAKNHEREAQIIAQAGRPGAITVATNIAGRGVDILLGGNPVNAAEAEKVRQSGGLHILGTERHESRRIDNQLRGRSGRQGDPGSSQFFVSMEDDLMRLFGGERMKSIMNTLGISDNEPIEAKMVSRSLESAQKKIEGLNFDTRKHVLEYDDVLNLQRMKIYDMRKQLLVVDEADERKEIEYASTLLAAQFDSIATQYLNLSDTMEPKERIDWLLQEAGKYLPQTEALRPQIESAIETSSDTVFAISDTFMHAARTIIDQKEAEYGTTLYNGVLRNLQLRTIDTLWMQHLDTMDNLRDSVRLRGYGQRDPLVEYKKEGYSLFQRLLNEIESTVAAGALQVTIHMQPEMNQAPTNRLQYSSNNAAQSGITIAAGGTTNQPSQTQTKTIDPAFAGVGRNDACPCGSGKKFKKCHGA